LGIAVLAIAALLAIGWVGSERAIHPHVAHYRYGPADFPDLVPQQFAIDGRDHTTLAAEFFPGARRATIVLSHGYGDNQVQMLPYAEFLHKSGFSVVTYDMRNRGRSGGDAVTLGALEQGDLISIVDALTRRADVDRDRIGALGVSLGGSTTLLAAAADSRIKAVVDDSGFSDAPNVIESSFEHFIGLPAFPFAPVTVSMVHLRTGIDATTIRPMDVVGRISPRPLLIVHCMQDKVVPPDNSDRNFAAAGEPKQFWHIPTGGHIAGHDVARAEYEQRVTQFFDQNLR
jgi:fermentation-respiration switch protein FrsA (DUF1100 family)